MMSNRRRLWRISFWLSIFSCVISILGGNFSTALALSLSAIAHYEILELTK